MARKHNEYDRKAHCRLPVIFRNLSESLCSILIEYLSIWAEISAMRLMAFEETVKGGVYIYPRVIPSFILSFIPSFIPSKLPDVVETLFRHGAFDPKEYRSLPG